MGRGASRPLTFGGAVLSPLYYLQRQVEAERERQRGWRTAARGAELVYGPPGTER